MKKSNTIEIIVTLLTCLFAYASFSKLFNHSLFVAELLLHPLIKSFAGLLAWAIPTTELTLVALLAISSTRLTGLYIAAGLLAIFTIYLFTMLLTEKTIPCSCGGIIGSLIWSQHILFNCIFIFLAITGILVYKRRDKSKNKSSLEL